MIPIMIETRPPSVLRVSPSHSAVRHCAAGSPTPEKLISFCRAAFLYPLSDHRCARKTAAAAAALMPVHGTLRAGQKGRSENLLKRPREKGRACRFRALRRTCSSCRPQGREKSTAQRVWRSLKGACGNKLVGGAVPRSHQPRASFKRRLPQILIGRSSGMLQN